MNFPSSQWWYRRSVESAIGMFIPLLAVLLLIKESINNNIGTLDGEGFVNALMDMVIIMFSATLGALLAINFQRHEEEKAQNEQSKQSHNPNILDTDGMPESKANVSESLQQNNSDGAPFKWAE